MKKRSLFLILLLAVFMPWAANAQETLTVCDGTAPGTTTATNCYVPINSYYTDTQGAASESIIPSTTLGMDELAGGTITKLTFHIPNPPATWGTPTIQVYMGEVDATTLSSLYGPTNTNVTIVSESVLDNTQTTIEVNLTTPYTYNGGNLLIGTYVKTKSSYSATYFSGIEAPSGSSRYRNNSSASGSAVDFLPKITFTYTPGSSSATAPGVTTNSTPTNLTDVSVTLGGNITDMGGATGVYAGICYSTTNAPTTSDSHVESRYTSATAYSKDITGLLPNTTYYYRAFAYNSANSLAEPTYGDVYSFTTGGTITLNQPANGEIRVSVAGGTATTSNTYALEGQSVTLTATPVEGYNLDCWNITGVTGTANGNTYTFTMPANNVTATASIVPTSGGSSSEFYYELATSVESGAKYLVVNGNGTTASASSSFYAMEWNNTTSTSGLLDYGTPTFKDTEKHKITGITPHIEGRTLSDFVWTITASGSDYTLSAENGGSTYYLIETSANDGNLHSYTTSNANYNADQTKWTFYKSSNEYFLIHNSYWYSQYSTPGGRYYYLYYSSGFKNYWSGTAPANQSGSSYQMYLYKETSTTTYAIVATANPTEGGTVAGSDYYASGTTCTLTATPAFGYDFVSWTENGTVVSTDASYTFTVSGARTLVANFESQGSCIKPTDLAQVPNTLAAHQAQLSWTENSGATQWEVVFSTDSDFNPDNETPIAVNENPATIPSLEQETTYYARVRAICGQSSQSGWSDKASFTTISGHQAPTSVSHDPATLEAHKVTITWTGVATNVLHQSYDVYYSTSDETPSQSQTPQYTGITATSKEIDGLDAAKTYYVWVRDYCGDDGYSDWTGAAPFTTECEAYTITSTYKYRQEFESPVVNSTYNSTTGLELPVCWENPYTTGSSNAGKPHLVKAGASYNYASSGQVLLFYGSGSNYVTLPEFTNNLQDLQISFKWATETSSSSAVLTLGYITEEDVNYNTFTAISDATTFTASATSQYNLIPAGPIELSALPATAKRLAFRWSYDSQYSCDVDDVVVELIPSCKIPTGLTCTDYTATTATFEWTTNGTNQTAWQLYISETNEAPSDDIDQNLVINANTNPFTVSSGLQAEHTYYAWVRGNCTASSEGYSEWSEGIEFMPSAYKDFTYQEGATSNTYYLPFYSYYTTSATKGQILIPASYFPTQMYDATVRHLTFYTTSSYATADWGNAEFDVLVAEMDATSFETAAFFDWDDMTTVYSGKLNVSDQQMFIELDAPFTYNGGNLLIGFNLTTTGTSKTVYWVATSGASYLGAYQYGTNSVSRSQYQPMITFNYLPNATPRPINPHATEELSTKATVVWTAPNSTEVTGYEYQYKLETETTWSTPETTTALTATIAGLTPEKTYDFRVRAIYPGSAYSLYAETQFTTTASCAIPDGLAASNITMVGADLTWNASVEVDNYTVEYRTAAQYDLFQGFENDFAGWTVINESTNSSGAAINVPEIRTDAAYHNTYGFRFSSWSSSSSGYNQYLISPELNYTGKIKFYYRNYSSSWSEKFKVGYSTTDTDLSSFAWSDAVTVTNTAYAEDKFFEETLPAGTKYVAIYYCTGSSNAYLYIDDITIGNLNPAGAWVEATHEAPNTGAYMITLPNAGVKYDVRVYAECALNPETESTTTSFTTLANGTKVFTNAGNDGLWSTGANWVPAGAPAISENAILRANATIESGCVAEAKKINLNSNTLTIADGGQLITNTEVTATVQKVINAYGETTADGGWYFIASPINGSSYSATSTGLNLITDTYGATIPEGQSATYDLYNFSQNPTLDENGVGNEWRNYRKSTFSLANGKGYLYASLNGTTLNFSGNIKALPTTASQAVSLTYASESTTQDMSYRGWNLVGNPFTFDTYVNMSYYKMNGEGSGVEPVDAYQTTTIAPCTGIMVQATATGQSVTFSKDAPSAQNGKGNLNIVLAQANVRNNAVMDKAVLSFNEGSQLSKFYFGQSKANIYFPQDNEPLAIVSSECQGEMPLNFKAYENGSYTLSFGSQNANFNYLRLIDNLTGAEVDLLQTPSYTFNATTTDYESRFKLVFATGNAADDSFAFYSNGNWIINNDGQATLQVIDVTGRILSSETVNGSVSTTINAAPGVYMLRLVNGDNVKVQKVVVR